MQPSYSELFLPLCLALCVPLCTGQSVLTYFVTPNTSTHCPGDPCYNLTTYVQNPAKYLQSYSTFILLPGVHYLDSKGPAIFQNLVNLQLRASDDCSLMSRNISTIVHQYGFVPYASDESISFSESSVQILCNNPSGLAFINITNLILYNLTILNCGSTFGLNVDQNCSVYMQDITNLIMDGVSIQNGTGFGLMGVDVGGESAVYRSSFVGNNQFVKDSIQRVQMDGLQCESKGTYYVNTLSLQLFGGNAYFTGRTPYLPATSATPQLSFSMCLFSLGVDGSMRVFTSLESPRGTGLIIDYDNANIDISDSTFYRNQANLGANLYISLSDPPSSAVVRITNVYSSKGIGIGSGLVLSLYHFDNLLLPVSNVTNSIFECNSKLGVDIVLPISIIANSFITGTTFNSSDVTVRAAISKFSDCNFINSTISVNLTRVYYNNCTFLYSPSKFVSTNSYYEVCDLVHSPSTVIYGMSNYSNCVLDYSSIDTLNAVLSLNGRFSCSHSSRQTNGGCIFLYTSTIVFNPGANVTFRNNTAINGGAIYMSGISFLNYTSPLSVTVSFLYNRAYVFGGAIYVDQPYFNFDPNHFCFYQFNNAYFEFHELDDVIVYSPLIAIAYVEGNTAGEVGSVLYGGDGSCRQSESDGLTIAATFIKAGPQIFTSSVISSDPLYVCQCNSTDTSAITCSNTVLQRYVYPGEIVQLQLASAGQNNSITPGVVLIFENTTDAGVVLVSVFRTATTCGIYTIPVPYGEGSLSSTRYFATETSIGTTFQNNFQLNVRVLQCPVGFDENKEPPSCVCEPLLASYGITCNISDQTIQRSGNEWIGYVTNMDNATVRVLGITVQCPYDYCINESRVQVSNFDYQCAYDREKVLCGQCRSGLSTTFGTSQCAKCSHYYLLLVIPFALMGVALVVMIFLLNLTVTNGTLNGLIFYANIVRINYTIFFPVTGDNGFAKFLSVFIAWLNLDFGIETCFYDGMDSYAKTWLQFAFPMYIFGLVSAIIVAGRCSSKISNLCKYNAVPVLATLILLSYSKILRTTIVIFSFGAIDAGNTTVPLVWLYDGNLRFFEFKHALLIAFGILITTFIIIPYTTVLLFLPCLQSKSDWRFLSWVNKLKPLFDSYAGPYKDRYRFWSGMLILLRLPLYLLFAISYSTNVRLLVIVIALFFYSLLLSSLSVYKRWSHSVLEGYFLVNLMAITVTKLFDPSSNNPFAVSVIVQIEVGFAFLGFAAIIVTHVIMAVTFYCKKKLPVSRIILGTNQGDNCAQLKNTSSQRPIGSEFTEMREPLLIDTD